MSKRREPAHFSEASVPPVGAYRYDAVTDQLWWSPQMYDLFGFTEGEVVPTLALMDAHVHPDDRMAVKDATCPAWEAGHPYTVRHRILDTDLAVRDVLVVGESILADGRFVTAHAYYVDVTAEIGNDVRVGVTTALNETLRTRAVIDQVKGALMLAYGVDAETAFSLLRGISNNHNVKLAQLAHFVAARLSTREPGGEPAQETLFQILASVPDHRDVIESWEPDSEEPDVVQPAAPADSTETAQASEA